MSDSDARPSTLEAHDFEAGIELRHALHSAILRRDERVGPELRVAVRDICDQARGIGVRAEQLLPLLKRLWFSLPEARHLAHGGQGDPLYDLVVSAAIEELYRV